MKETKKVFKKRSGPPRKKQMPETGYYAFCSLFARNWIDYVTGKGMTVADVVRRINAEGEIKLRASRISQIAIGHTTTYNTVYFFHILAKAVDKDIMDFVSIRIPQD